MKTSTETPDCVAISIDEKLNRLGDTSTDCCIFKVREHVRRLNNHVYGPTTLAIGPYHRRNPNLQEMERQKLLYLRQLLHREQETSADKFVAAMRKLETRARKCYAGTVGLDTDEFVEMMLLDSCFIVELFRKYKMKNMVVGEDLNVQSIQVRRALRGDLILLENQLPFFVLLKFFNMTKIPHPEDNIIDITLHFLEHIVPNKTIDVLKGIELNNIKHILGLIHFSWCHSFSERRKSEMKSTAAWNKLNEYIGSATELEEAGVHLKMVKKSNVFDIKFENGVLEIPTITIADDTENFLCNLIAYEQCFPSVQQRYVSDYIFFIDGIVNTPNDVQLLRCRGIIKNDIADDVEVYKMLSEAEKFSSISEPFSYSDIFSEVIKYSKRRRNRWMATLRRDYFNSPWALVSFVAAIILLILTVAQTIFTVLSYYSA